MTNATAPDISRRINVALRHTYAKDGWLNIGPAHHVSHARLNALRDLAAGAWVSFDDIDYVYADQYLGNVTIDQAVAFLGHAHHALSQVGQIRLVMPSLEWIIATHFDPAQSDPAAMIAQTFKINRAFHGWGHKFLWSKLVLTEALKATGYRDIRFVEAGQSADPVFRGLEATAPRAPGAFAPNWIVEARKAEGATPDPALLERAERDLMRHVRAGH